MAYIYLTIAILTEVAATSALKASEEFTKLGPSLFVIIGYATSFYCLSIVFRTLPVGITYAIWTGIGIFLVTLAGFYLYQETPDFPAILGMAFIIIGVAIITLFSKST